MTLNRKVFRAGNGFGVEDWVQFWNCWHECCEWNMANNWK